MKIRPGRRWLPPQAMAGIAVAGLLAACAAGSHENTAPAPASSGMKDGIGAPAPEFGPAEQPNAQRDVVKTASMAITVSNTSDAADKAAVIVEDAGGRVDSRSEDAGSGRGRANTSVVLRVPAAKLDDVMRQLKALQTSVDRLLAIMRDAKDPDALIKAEGALSERQAELDSLRAQRDQLGARIDYSTVDVNFVADQIGGPEPQQYSGFFGQVERGWDGLVSVAGHFVMLFGLLLPWFGVLVVVGGIGYGLLRVVRARRP